MRKRRRRLRLPTLLIKLRKPRRTKPKLKDKQPKQRMLAMGNLFQISNQTTLGEKEEEIINRLTKVIETIIDKEHDARQTLLQRKPNTLCDQIGRAYGVLTYAHGDRLSACAVKHSARLQDNAGIPP